MLVWHTLSANSVATELHTDIYQGLGSEEARQRLKHHGPNELKGEEGIPLWRKLLAQFQDFLVLILLAAGAISFAVGERTDAVLILLIVVVNAVLGVVQEGRAQRALNALKEMAAPHAVVIRDGQTMDVPARELVPGDVVLLETGAVVPSDLRLTHTASLKVEEAALTGESVPVEKDAGSVLAAKAPLAERSNMAYMGTTVVYGRGQGIAVNTGMNTEMGRIADLLTAAPESVTPLQERLNALGKILGIVTLVISVLVFVTGIVRDGYGVDWLQLFLVAVSLAVAAIPEGLPAVVTIVLALGMQRMVTKNAVVKKLHAVETLGSTTVICTDKTGTLTQNKMAAVALWAGRRRYTVEGSAYGADGQIALEGHRLDAQQLQELRLPLLTAALCNDARVEELNESEPDLVGDPTEGALLGLAAKAKVTPQALVSEYPRVAEVPFDSRRKLMSTIHPAEQGGYLVLTKGAPDVVLGRARYILMAGAETALTPDLASEIREQNAQWAGQALRVLALAYRKLPDLPAAADLGMVEEELTFLAIVGLKDPLRLEAKQAVQRCRGAGIRTVMITGDHPETALAIGRELGLSTAAGVLTGVELDELTPDDLKEQAQQVNVYARVAPEHKSAIVQALQDQNEIVAVTGDGVNDAPALKQANIGVAMGITGTDVAKGAADMILTDDNFASIVSAVEEGRVIYANIRKFVYFLLSCNVGEVLIVFLAQLMALPLPLLPVHLLWLNLLTDAFPALALGVEQAEPGVMLRLPRSPREPLLDRSMQYKIVGQGLALTVSILGVFWLALPMFDLQVARTMAFATLVMAELLRSFSTRSERLSIFKLGLFTNRTLVWGSSISLVAFLITLYVPGLRPVFKTALLTGNHWSIIMPAAFLPSVVAEISKMWAQPKRPRQRKRSG